MNTLIKLSNIHKQYRVGKITNRVLSGFSWEFKECGFTVIAGPSGSGKSTLLNILATLDRPDEGACFFEGKEINFSDEKSLTTLRKNNFGFVFQSFNLIPVLTALENVELPLTLSRHTSKEQTRRAMQVLELVGLKAMANQKPGELSGGEQQRVAIARAIATHPKVIFADEPTANLDRHNAEKIVHLMKSLNTHEGTSFIIASHDEKVISSGKEVILLDH
jgi:putative ABC transport system ATP-binding protein